MRMIKESKFRRFWEGYPDSIIAERAFKTFIRVARLASWGDKTDLRRTFRTADVVGHCVVFDIGGNSYRPIARMSYRLGRIYVLEIMDHREYDRTDWANRCGCHRPPPGRE